MYGSFYQSKDWLDFRNIIISERLNKKGQTICEYCKKPIYKKYDIILHHIIPLNETNYEDVNISLNPKNIQIVHHGCHNKIHNNFQNKYEKIYLVYGAPLSGKSTFVRDNMIAGDLVLDIDNIWQCITNQDKYIKPNGLKTNVFDIRDLILEQIKHRLGFWKNCYIMGGYPLVSERERLANELNAEIVFIDTTKKECLKRLENLLENSKNTETYNYLKKYKTYIDDWFDKACI